MRITILILLIVVNSHFNKVEATLCHRTEKFETTTKGVYKIIGMFPIKYSIIEELNINAVLWTEVMVYTINKINKQFSRNLFEHVIYDSCGSEHFDALTDASVSLMISAQTNETSCQCIENNSVQYTLGVVGPTASSNSEYISNILQTVHIPMISYASTSPKLSDVEKFPNFFRTVPPDTYQAKFMKDVLLGFDWTYVSIVATDDTYGRYGLNTLTKELNANRICISVAETFSVPFNKAQVTSIIQELSKETLSKVIILWGSFDLVKAFLEEAKVQRLHNKVWVISEAAGLQEYFTRSENKVLGKFLLTNPVSGQDLEFENYFFTLSYKDSLIKPWLKAFFEVQNITNDNDSNLPMNNFRSLFNPAARTGSIQNAVRVFTTSLLKYISNQSNCSINDITCKLPPVEHRIFTDDYIKNVSIPGLLNETIRFDVNGDINVAYFDLYLIVSETPEEDGFTIDDSCGPFCRMLRWSSTRGFSNANTNVFSTLNMIKSQCSDVCDGGFYPVFHAVKTCCWICVKCAPNYNKSGSGLDQCVPCLNDFVSNSDRTACVQLQQSYVEFYSAQGIAIMTLSVVGMLSTIFSLVTFIVYQNTPIVRSSHYRFSLLQLFAIFILFCTPFLYLGTETTVAKCAVRLHGFCLFLVIILSIALMKVTKIVQIFKMTYVQTKSQMQRDEYKLKLILFLSIIIEVIIITHLMYIDPPSIKRTQDLQNFTVEYGCDDQQHFLVQIIYILILQIICVIQSFRCRGISSKYNEAKFMGMAMFTSTLVYAIVAPLKSSMATLSQQNILLAFITCSASSLLLYILYGYKVVLIWCFPKENTKKTFREARMKRVRKQTMERFSRLPKSSNSTSTSEISVDTKKTFTKSISVVSLGTDNFVFHND